MAKSISPLARRLHIIPPPVVLPAPKPAASPAMIAAAQNPNFGAPVTQTPPTAPGMLPTTETASLYDPQAAPVASAAPPDSGGWQGALQRALIGFNKGASRIPLDPTYNPVGAGLIGGIQSIGAQQEDAVNRKLAAQAAAQKPFADAQTAALKTSYEEKAREPFKKREQQDTLNRELELARGKVKLETAPENIEDLAQNLATLPPSIRQMELGRQAGPVRMALINRIFEINKGGTKTDAEREQEYQRVMAGGKAGAVYDTSGTGQRTARAANSVKLLTPELLKASEAFSRTDLPLANTLYAKYDIATGGDRALGFQQYLTDTKLKMASALMQGGVPTDQATNIIEHAFPAGMTHPQVAAAVKNIDNIMDTQIKGGLTPVSLTPPAASAAAAGAAPAPGTAAPATPWSGGPVHTYPDGTKAQFINGKWQRVP